MTVFTQLRALPISNAARHVLICIARCGGALAIDGPTLNDEDICPQAAWDELLDSGLVTVDDAYMANCPAWLAEPRFEREY